MVMTIDIINLNSLKSKFDTPIQTLKSTFCEFQK